MSVLLLQFPYAHYDEKARWALAYKGVVHERRNLLPGPHRHLVRRLTGLTRTPVLIYNDEIVCGSQNIVLSLERKFPDTRRLVPEDDRERCEALALAESLDEIVGPPIRTCLLGALARAPDYLADSFLAGHARYVQSIYRTAFPLIKTWMLRANGAGDEASLAAAARETTKAFDRIACRVNGRDYLIGKRFSIADLTAAALLAPLVEIDHPDMKRPEPLPAALHELRSGFATHVTARWVQEIYARHRPRFL